MQKFLCLLMILWFGGAKAQAPDSLKPGKKPIKALYFKKKMSLRNGALKFRYNLDKKPVTRTDSFFAGKYWKLTFEDNFDTLDLKKWRVGQAWGEMHPDNPHQYYSASQVQVRNGYLFLGGAYQPKQIMVNDSLRTFPYAIGLINTDISFTQKYGYFEIRSRNPSGPATWPAFWLTGATKWPPEIDIFEMYGGKTGKSVHKQVATIHWGKSGTRSRGFMSKKINLPDDTDSAFHTYGCEWTREYIRFYTDGHLVSHVRVNKRLAKWLDEEMVVVINNCFERQYLKYLPEGFIRNDFVVDYVRVYKHL